jgi:hypothetical protein
MPSAVSVTKNLSFGVSILAAVVSVATAVFSLYGFLPNFNVPQLPAYVSDWMSIDTTPSSACGAALNGYAAKYPRYTIDLKSFEANSRDFSGHPQYRYTCSFVAKAK